jgi:RNA polymerase sigma-70 factor (ECF subfamily)
MSLTPTVPDQPDAAVESVWRDLHDPLLRFITRRVPDRASAEDILQEVMLRLHRHADEIRRVDSVSGWMHTISRNAITDYYRAAARREVPVDNPTPIDEPDPVDGLEPGRGELTGCLEPLLARLPPTYQEALQLTDLDGLTQAEAGARLGLSASGMKSRVQRARSQLRDLFSDCCDIHLDRRGGVIDYQPRGSGACSCTTTASGARSDDENFSRSVEGSKRRHPHNQGVHHGRRQAGQSRGEP